MRNFYLNHAGEESASGIIPVIEVVDSNQNTIRYYVSEMVINFYSSIRILGYKKVKPNGIDSEYLDSAFELSVTNSTYRKLADFTIHTAETALNQDGSLKQGYIGELDLFVQMFGHNSIDLDTGIYSFIVDAVERKFSLV